MKRYRIATWQTNTGLVLPFIYKDKAYALYMKHGPMGGQVEHNNYKYVVTNGTNKVIFNWQKVSIYDDIKHDPDGIEISWSKDEELNEVARWLDEQILTEYEMIDIDDLITFNRLSGVLSDEIIIKEEKPKKVKTKKELKDDTPSRLVGETDESWNASIKGDSVFKNGF